jgi:hypothetical protein
MECFDSTVICCPKIKLTSTGSLRFYHTPILGEYSRIDDKNNRILYKHVEEDYYFHYNDWGLLEVS